MISYDPFWKTLEKSGETTYTLIYKWGVSSNTISRIRDKKPMSTPTIDVLCQIFNCGVGGIIEYIPTVPTVTKRETSDKLHKKKLDKDKI